MRLVVARMVIGGLAALLVAGGLFLRWQGGSTIERHRERVLDLCAADLAATAADASVDVLRRELSELWEWGSYELPSHLFADRLPHATERFAAVRVTRHQRLPGEGRLCRVAMCVYSIPLDRAAAVVSNRRCGGAGVTEAVTPTLKPDILNAR